MTPDPKPQKRIKDAALVKNFSLRAATCAVCGASRAKGLSAHHVLYKGGRRGDDVVANLVALCGHGTAGCHGAVHAGNRSTRHLLGQHIVLMRPDTLEYLEQKLGPEAAREYLVREFAATEILGV